MKISFFSRYLQAGVHSTHLHGNTLRLDRRERTYCYEQIYRGWPNVLEIQFSQAKKRLQPLEETIFKNMDHFCRSSVSSFDVSAAKNFSRNKISKLHLLWFLHLVQCLRLHLPVKKNLMTMLMNNEVPAIVILCTVEIFGRK